LYQLRSSRYEKTLPHTNHNKVNFLSPSGSIPTLRILKKVLLYVYSCKQDDYIVRFPILPPVRLNRLRSGKKLKNFYRMCFRIKDIFI